MAQRETYHVTPVEGGDWRVKAAGAQKASGVHALKKDAVAQAKDLAKGQPLGQVVIHGADNKIQTEYTYGKDPCPPPG